MKLKFGEMIESNWNYPMSTELFRDALREFGIEVVESGQDLTFNDHNRGEIEGPTVLFCRLDTSLVVPNCLRIGEENKDVVGYCVPLLATEKNDIKSIARSVYAHQEPWIEMCKPVSPVNTMLWYLLSRYEPEVAEKTIRASFCGTTRYSRVPFATWHRRRLMNKWSSIEGLTYGMFNSVRGHVFGEVELHRITARSKVVVSPWGVCEISVRDYEAVLGCAMIVKPRQSTMETYCNPWTEENVVYCDPSFCDLPEAVQKAEDKWNWSVLSDIRDEHLRLGSDISALAELFSQSIGRIPSCYK